MIEVRVGKAIIDAWEEWVCVVPDDFPVGASEFDQMDWLWQNSDLIEWVDIEDAGSMGSSITHVEVTQENI